METKDRHAWKTAIQVGSQLKIIPSSEYAPQPKAPSRRDLIRAGLRKRKFSL